MDAVDADALVGVATDLIALATLSGEEVPGQRVVAERLADLGLDVETWDIDLAALSQHPAYSAEIDRDTSLGVVGRLGSPGGPTLLVDGHIDVVPTGELALWSSPPFEGQVRDERLYGRGACDMKGGLAAAIHAADAIRRAGIDLAGTLAIASVVGEEDGGCGTLALLEHGVTADACLIPEPTQLTIAPASAGALSWRIRIRGRSAHGALREEGVSAIEKLIPVHEAVLALEERRNRRTATGLFGWLDRPFAICGGRVAGGDWPSSEADWLTWEGRYGVAPGEDLDAARAEFEAAVAAVGEGDAWLSQHPPRVEWWGGTFLPGETPRDDAIVATVTGAVGALGSEPVVRGMPYGCDLGLTVGVGGIPTVVYGPGDVRDAHRPDESVAVEELVAAARTIALTALRFCGTG